jgi:pilus assembly protein Flp/PilA
MRDERAATAIEYALIASGVSIAIAGTVAVLGGNVQNFYSSVATALK